MRFWMRATPLRSIQVMTMNITSAKMPSTAARNTIIVNVHAGRRHKACSTSR